MKPKKIVEYHDALEDEFSGTNIKRIPLPPSFKYVHKNIFWRASSWFVYFCIARPILWCVGMIWKNVKVEGKKNLKAIKKTGAFFYGNHTQILDGWSIQCYVSSKRSYVVSNQDSTSIRGLRWFISMLGCVPLPENKLEKDKFLACIEKRREQNANIIIYPEAHIWPYCTHIRPFKDDSFVYPAQLGSPVVAFVTTYSPRKIFKNKPPRVVIHVSKPFYPNMEQSLPERKEDLRKKVYDFMINISGEEENVEYIRYVKTKD